ncbi:MAG: prepilin peptidase [Halobacteriaceae archaeon]
MSAPVVGVATPADTLRLLAVPVLGWAAWRDVRTRRVRNETWYPLLALAAVALGYEAWTGGHPDLGVRVLLSVGIVVPIAYALWWLGGFGGADAKALMVLAVLFPTYPTYYLPSTALPLHATTAGVFSLTILTDAVLAGAAYPVALGLRNLLAGRVSTASLVGVPVRWDEVPDTHGRLLESPDGFTRHGLDLDALRMYLRWRGVSLAAVRADPSLRDPATLPADPNDPTDGAVAADGGTARPADRDAGGAIDYDDPWGAAAFLDAVDHDAYGTTPDQLRDGLDLLAERETVWVSPGIPFLVPLFVGLCVALVFGDALFVLLAATGLV